MSNISDNDLDKIFKDAAEKYETTFDENAWKAMEQRLDLGNGGFGYFKAIGSIVGIFLIGAFLIWFYTPEGAYDRSDLNTTQNDKRVVPDIKNPLSLNDNAKGHKRIRPVSPKDAASTIPITDENASSEEANSDNSNLSSGKHEDKGADSKVAGRNKKIIAPPITGSFKAPSQPGEEDHQQLITAQNRNGELVFTTDYPSFLQRLGYVKLTQEPGRGNIMKVEQQNEDDEEQSHVGNLALKILYSPDLTSVGYFKPDRPGSNFGLVAEYFITSKWSVSTGAIYARKIYFTEEEQIGSGYYGTTKTMSKINGDCRVIDIPLNISYYIRRSDNHSIYVSAGSSSYLMLMEHYNYTTMSNGNEKVWSQEIKSKNNHFFGLLNLSVGYERRIKGNLYLQIAPFLKAPIAGIGEGKVDLVSTGAFLNLKYQFR